MKRLSMATQKELTSVAAEHYRISNRADIGNVHDLAGLVSPATWHRSWVAASKRANAWQIRWLTIMSHAVVALGLMASPYH